MPIRLHTCTIHLADVPGSKWGFVLLQPAGDKGKAYVITLALTDALQALSIHFETHEDVLVPPHPLGSTIGSWLENKGPTPCPLCLEPVFSPWHTLDFIRPQSPNDSCYWSFYPLERLILMLLSYLGGIVTKGCYYCTLFYYFGLN